MEKNLRLPAGYAVLDEEELTYTTGGGAVTDAITGTVDTVTSAAKTTYNVISIAATVIGVGVLLSSYVWGIRQSRSWLAENRYEGNFLTVMGLAMDDLAADMSSSTANLVRDLVSTFTVVALAPISAILILVE